MKKTEFVRVPPHSNEAEITVLGGILLNPDSFYEIELTAEDFYKDAHKKIFMAMARMFRDGHPVDEITLTDKLKKSGMLEEIGGGYYIVGLSEAVPSSANIKYWAEIVKEKSDLRKIIITGQEMTSAAYDATAGSNEIISKLLAGVENIGSVKSSAKPVRDEIESYFDYISKINSREIVYYRTGLTKIDDINGGLQGGNLVIIGARTSIGKSALAQNIAINIDDGGNPVVFFSYEMLKQELMTRHLQIKTQRSFNFLNNNDLNCAIKSFDSFDNDIIYDDNPENSEFINLSRKINLYHKKNGTKVFVVDYLQLMNDVGEKKLEKMENITRGLKILANKLGIVIILLSQINRGGKDEPKLSDLKHAGSIEEDADIVILLHSPEEEKANPVRLTDLYVAKYRGGRVCRGELYYKGKTQTFRETNNFYNDVGF